MRYCEYYCNCRHHSLVVKHRMKHISSRGPYLASRKAANSASLLSPYKSRHSSTSERKLWHLSKFFLWFGPILSFHTTFHQSSYFFSLTWSAVGHFSALLLFSVLHHWLQFEDELELIWNRGEQTLRLRKGGALPSTRVRREGLPQRLIDTSQTLPLALIGFVYLGVGDSCKSNYSHWVEPQTADLYLILLSDHNDNFSNYFRLQHKVRSGVKLIQ